MVGRRLLQAIPVIFGASLITFALLNLLPGNTAIAILGDGATPQAVKNLDRELGQMHAAVRTGAVLLECDDPDAFEWAARHVRLRGWGLIMLHPSLTARTRKRYGPSH